MTRRRGLLLLALQTALLLFLAGRLLLDRALLPRGWARAVPVDPELPIRGRYLTLRLDVPLVGKAPTEAGANKLRLVVRGGRVVGEPLAPAAWRPGLGMAISRRSGALAQLSEPLAFFLPEHAPDPSRRPPGEELWAEVTLPERGAPRPIRLGVKRAGQPDPIPLPLR
jgi:hypothetical protein